MSFPSGWETPVILALPALPAPIIGVDFSKVSAYPDLEVSLHTATSLGSFYTSTTTPQTLKNQGKLQFFTATQQDINKLFCDMATYGNPATTLPVISFQTSNPSHKVWSYTDTESSCASTYQDVFDASTKSVWEKEFFSPIFVVDNASSKVLYAVMPVGVYETVNNQTIPVIQLQPCPTGTCGKGPYATCIPSTTVHSSHVLATSQTSRTLATPSMFATPHFPHHRPFGKFPHHKRVTRHHSQPHK